MSTPAERIRGLQPLDAGWTEVRGEPYVALPRAALDELVAESERLAALLDEAKRGWEDTRVWLQESRAANERLQRELDEATKPKLLEDLIERGEVASVLIVKGDYSDAELELIRRAYGEGCLVSQARCSRLEAALRAYETAIERHDLWCGHKPDAPGDGSLNEARRLAREALTDEARLNEEGVT